MKCYICGGDVPLSFHVMWCDDCIDAQQDSGLTPEEFVRRAKAEA